MDNHVAKMLDDDGNTNANSHTGDRWILRPFAKRDTIQFVQKKLISAVPEQVKAGLLLTDRFTHAVITLVRFTRARKAPDPYMAHLLGVAR